MNFFTKFLTGAILVGSIATTGLSQSNPQSINQLEKKVTQVDKKDGIISGRIIEGETGEPLPGVNVFIPNTILGASTDLDGYYRIENVPNGEYDLNIQMIGYTNKIIEDIDVENNNQSFNASLKSSILETEVITVTAKAARNNEMILLKDRQKSVNVSDAISAKTMSNSGSSDAAQAMKHVVGASVVDGKEIFIRGLGDRYTATQLNGAELPSANLYKRSGAIDIIPTNLLDNIVTVKSFTPDKSGNFSGGIVNIKTKDFPEKFTLNFGSGTSFNPNVNLSDNFILYGGGNKDWLGMDDGTRDVPKIIRDENIKIPTIGKAGTDLKSAEFLDEISKSFNTIMTPTKENAPLNQSYSLSVGDKIFLWNKPVGLLGCLSYKRNFSGYSEGVFKRYTLGTDYEETKELVENVSLKDNFGKDEVSIGLLGKISFQYHPMHKLSLNFLKNKNGESKARSLSGKNSYDLDDKSIFNTSVLHYSERNLNSFQIDGENQFPWFKFFWKGTNTNTEQDEPDLRYFTSFSKVKNGERLYGIKPNTPPHRFYRWLDENKKEVSFDMEIPFKQWNSLNSKIKVGGLFSDKDRNFSERLFVFNQEPVFEYSGDSEELFGENNLGWTGTTEKTIRGVTYIRYDFGLTPSEVNNKGNNYKGEHDVSAVYAMINMPIMNKLRFVGGARFEKNKITTKSYNELKPEGKIISEDILSSANLIYSLKDNMNLRFSYGKTLALPTLREVAPYASWDFVGGNTYIGNTELKTTKINNYDLRWEWFQKPGEIMAVSAFQKDFKNPIEEHIFTDNREIKWLNVDRGRVRGLEFEVRKKLDFIPKMENFLIGANYSMIKSEVDIGEKELESIRVLKPDTEKTRQMVGQSPYLLNILGEYKNPNWGLSVGANYNLFGDRLAHVSMGATPDVYEKASGLLNVYAKQNLWGPLKLKISGNNLTNDKMTKKMDFKGKEYIYQQYSPGRTFSIGLSVDL